MHKNKLYIDQNFDISGSETENSFAVDELIAQTISILNKKSYFTQASCSGHYLDGNCEEVMSILKVDVEKEALLEWLKQNNLEFIREDETSYYYMGKILGGACYVKFVDELNFANFPKYFEHDSNSIYHMINYFEENGNKRTKEEVEKEILDVNKSLKEWTDVLKERS